MPGLGPLVHEEAACLPWSQWSPIPYGVQDKLHQTTSFQAAGDGICEEGFRCVSRISKFGTGHWGQVDVGKEEIADAEGSAPVYEWGCPFQGEWSENKYESGPGDDQCTDEGDCICIARGSPDMHTELEGGHEKIIGKFETQSGKAHLGHEPQLIQVIPHYSLRTKDGAPFDIDNPHSGLGTVKEFDREATIDSEYRAKVQDGGPFVCDGAQPAGQEPSLTKAETQLNLMRIRRFQVLASDCVNMRDTAAKVAGKPDEEAFAPSGKSEGGDELKCFKKKDSTECQQINCYRGFEDQGFLDRLQLLKTQLDSCRPEEDTPLVGVVPEAEKSEVAPEGAPEGTQATDATGAVATESGAQGTEETEGTEGSEGKQTGGVEPTGETQKELPAGQQQAVGFIGLVATVAREMQKAHRGSRCKEFL